MSKQEFKMEIDGLQLISGKQFEDLRGRLLKPYSTDFFEPEIRDELNMDFREVWFTQSKYNVIRGMHLQISPHACEKFVSVISGKVLDVILDLRLESPSYGKVFSVILDGNFMSGIYIPKGCAHGYRVLTDNSLVMYMATDINVSSCDIGIRWDSFGFDWGIVDPILSDKDRELAPFEYGVTDYGQE